MRKLYLENEIGEKFYFDYSSKVLISGIQGLGFTKQNSYFDYTNIYKKIEEVNPTQEIVLTLTFLEKYLGFARFLSFIEGSKNYLLYYEATDLKYAYVEIESLTKTEISGGALTSELKLTRLSYWYKNVISDFEIHTSPTGKIYSYTYPYTYSSSTKGWIEITNNGYAPAPLKVTIEGVIKDPEIIVYKDGEEVSRLKIYYESSDAKVEVDAFPTRQAITIYEDDEEIDGYEYQDFSADNFILLEKGTYELVFISNAETSSKCSILMSEGYLGN